ncbi:MAG: hypothetical protein LBG09_00060 [Puniceicoccales bacterium]|jgi:methyl-accepting chemotaxis protein|nr:hypothetical protein [Puniceicoccales bacterium]
MGIKVDFGGQNVNVSYMEAAKAIKPNGNFFSKLGTAIKLIFTANDNDKGKIVTAFNNNQIKGQATLEGRKKVSTRSVEFQKKSLEITLDREKGASDSTVKSADNLEKMFGALKATGLTFSPASEAKISEFKNRANEIKDSYEKIDVGNKKTKNDVKQVATEMLQLNGGLTELNESIGALNASLTDIAVAAKECFEQAEALLGHEPENFDSLLTELKNYNPTTIQGGQCKLNLLEKISELQLKCASLGS